MHQTNTSGGFRGLFHHGNKLLYFNGDPNRNLSFFNETDGNPPKTMSNANYITIGSASPVMIFSVAHTGGFGQVFKNSENVTSISTAISNAYTCSSNLMLGRTNWNPNENVFNGLVGDFMFFNTALAPADRLMSECYLSSKYSIPLAGGAVCP